MRAQLDAVFDDIGVDAAKTGMLFSRTLIETVAAYLRDHPVPLVVDPVMVASSGAKLLEDDAVAALIGGLFPLATVVTPNLMEARALTGSDGSRRELAARLHDLGAPAAIVTGGHGDDPVDHLFDGTRARGDSGRASCAGATHGAGCTHSATLAALLARGWSLVEPPAAPPRPRSRGRAGSSRSVQEKVPSTSWGCEHDDLGRCDPGAIRERKPLVHQITNYVVMNETANATLALGALPVMAHASEEVEEMARLASSLVLNIGTLSGHWVEAMLLAGRAATARRIPVVLDPVGVGATEYRTATARRILDLVGVTVLRGNAVRWRR